MKPEEPKTTGYQPTSLNAPANQSTGYQPTGYQPTGYQPSANNPPRRRRLGDDNEEKKNESSQSVFGNRPALRGPPAGDPFAKFDNYDPLKSQARPQQNVVQNQPA